MFKMANHYGKQVLPAAWASDLTFGDNVFVPIRVFLALLVIFSHSFILIQGTDASEPLRRVSDLIFGEVAVNLFLAISGFLVTRSWDLSGSTRSYLAKRVRRVYPAFLVLMALQAFILAPLVCSEAFHGYTLKQLGIIAFDMADLVGYGFPYGGLLLTTFTHNPFPGAMNGSLWTIRYEFICYLLLPLLGSWLRHSRICTGAFVAVLALYLSRWLPPWHFILTAVLGNVALWPRLLTYFLAGMTFYRLRHLIPQSKVIALVSFLILALTTLAWPWGVHVTLPTCGVYLLFYLAYFPPFQRLPRILPGDPSYGIYLYGFPIQQTIVYLGYPNHLRSPYFLTLIAAVLATACGLASWHLIEKRFVARKPRQSANDDNLLLT